MMELEEPAVTPPVVSYYTDLEGYLSRYAPGSETLLQRCLFLASMCSSSSPQVAQQCYQFADQLLKSNGNTLVYRQVFAPPTTNLEEVTEHDKKNKGSISASGVLHQLHHVHPHIAKLFTNRHPYDSQWVNHADHAALIQEESLQSRLSSAQSHLSKEAIRSALLALGDFYFQRGMLREALRCIFKSRDVSTSHVQISEMCFKVIQISLDLADYAQASSFVSKAAHSVQQLSKGADNALASAKVHAASALCLFLNRESYSEAALKFASVPMELTFQYNTVISPEDIALYGTILCLATQDRVTIQRIFGISTEEDAVAGSMRDATGISTASTSGQTSSMGASSLVPGSVVGVAYTIKQRLELLPWLSELVQHYMRAEYGPCLSLLQRHLRELELDLRLHPHITILYDMTRDKCMVQYLSPYTSVKLSKMKSQFAGCFPPDGDALEVALVELIGRGHVNDEKTSQSLAARINTHDKTVILRNSVPCSRRQRVQTQQRIQLLSEKFQRDTEALLLRTICIERGMVLTAEHHAGSLTDGWADPSSGRSRERSRRDRGYGAVADGVESSDDDEAMKGEVVQGVGYGAMLDNIPMEENGQDA